MKHLLKTSKLYCLTLFLGIFILSTPQVKAAEPIEQISRTSKARYVSSKRGSLFYQFLIGPYQTNTTFELVDNYDSVSTSREDFEHTHALGFYINRSAAIYASIRLSQNRIFLDEKIEETAFYGDRRYYKALEYINDYDNAFAVGFHFYLRSPMFLTLGYLLPSANEEHSFLGGYEITLGYDFYTKKKNKSLYKKLKRKYSLGFAIKYKQGKHRFFHSLPSFSHSDERVPLIANTEYLGLAFTVTIR